jgi:hypothetical protein
VILRLAAHQMVLRAVALVAQVAHRMALRVVVLAAQAAHRMVALEALVVVLPDLAILRLAAVEATM